MRTRNCSLVSAMGVLVLAVAMVPGALAQCGLNKNYVKPAAWHPQLGSAQFLHAALLNDDDRDDHDDPDHDPYGSGNSGKHVVPSSPRAVPYVSAG